MAQKVTSDGGDERFDSGVSLEDVRATKENGGRVRIAPKAVEVRERGHPSERAKTDVDGIAALLYAEDFNSHMERAVLYDSEADLFAVVSAHKRSEAMNHAENDWKVRSVGATLSGELTDGEFESEKAIEYWIDWLLGDVVQYGDDGPIHAVRPYDGFEITVKRGNEGGIIGDRFALSITASDE